MSKYGDVIRHARQTEGQQTEKPENQKNGKPENRQSGQAEERPEEVNLSIKVPKTLRRHWVSEAKRQDTTLTAVIIEALKARFGAPPEI